MTELGPEEASHSFALDSIPFDSLIPFHSHSHSDSGFNSHSIPFAFAFGPPEAAMVAKFTTTPVFWDSPLG